MKTSSVAATVSLLLCGVVEGATYVVPDPTVQVNPNYGGNTTIVVLEGVTYRGPSQFYYVGECSKPDALKYHCDVMAEAGVVLTEAAVPHRRVVVDLTIQYASVLATSGHNQWLHSTILLAGEVRTI